MNRIILLTVFTATYTFATGQICDGNLGENIFTDGDFGSGEATFLPEDPRIAPGYTYARSGPVPDGMYTITNDMGDWGQLYGTWLPLKDNSTDSDGYMMVVNASFEPGNFYEEIVDGLCENTRYVFTADIINVVSRSTANHIKPNVTFLLDDEVQYTTGDIPQDETWKTYGFTFETTTGQTSLKLTLRNNAPGGIGNDLALDNIAFQACGPEALILPREIANICEDGDPISLEATVIGDQFATPAFQWQESFDSGASWQDIPGANQQNFLHNKLASGFYYYRYLLSNSITNVSNSKCAIISNTKVVFVQPKFYSLTDTICEGLNFKVGSSIYDQTGIYIDSLLSSLGCDSIVTLDLTVVPDQNITVDRSIVAPSCFGASDAAINIENINNAYDPVNFMLTNLSTNTISSTSGISSGNYVLSVVDHYGCSYEEQIQIDDPVPFILELGEDTTIQLGQPLRLSISSNYNIVDFESSFSDSICQQDCFNIEWYPTQTDVYAINGISEFGCVSADSIQVTIEVIRKAYFPNVFTPNGDGANDYFTVFGALPLLQEVESLQIFDRWGQLLFEQFNFSPNIPEAGWNGLKGNQQLSEGIYVYQAKVRFLDEVVEVFSGDILLLKN